MFKKSFLVALSLVSTAVMAQNYPQQPQNGQQNPQAGGPNGGGNGQMFQQRKQEVLNRLQNAIQCVQAAQNRDQLRDCAPRRHHEDRNND
jgi:hypothetical protein